MTRIRQILFATDFSRTSTKAFATAVALTKVTNGRLTILHAIAPFAPFMPEQYIGTQTWEEIDLQGREWAKRELTKSAEKARSAGVRAVQLLVDGEPARQIVRMARSQKADLIVVGTHGRTGFTQLVLGSVAARVVATAHCPVVTVRSK